MLKMNLQLFAHKKGVGSTRTAEILRPRDLAPRERTDSLCWLATFFTDSAVQKSIPE